MSADESGDHRETAVVSTSSMAATLAHSPIDGMKQSFQHLRKEMADRSTEMKNQLRRFQGKVFHAVNTTHGTMLRYRVEFDGRITLEKRLRGIYVTAEKIQEARENLVKAGKDVPKRAQRRWRKAVTGDPDKRIRDHLRETPQVKMMDKVSFTIGVMSICFAEWLILRLPNYFPLFYYGLMAGLLAYRYYDYSLVKSELYMIDFCYFVNLSVVLQTAFDPANESWFKANYALCMGPISVAIVVWRNSLVFHSLDKVTSFFLHAFPTMVCHIYRWKLVDHGLNFDEGYMGVKTHLVIPFSLYFVWQIGYLFITESLLKGKLSDDPDYVTSLRYLTRDNKNPANRIVSKLCRRYGLLKAGEGFDPETMLAKVVFVVSQLTYTAITIIHPPILYQSYMLSCVYLVAVFAAAVWNGASYYIEVFSKRYNLKFEEKTDAGRTSEKYFDAGGSDDEDFAEALEELDLDELLASQLLADEEDDSGKEGAASREQSVESASTATE